MNKNSISTDQELRVGEYLVSVNGKYKAIFQEDGNFVIYSYGSTIWATGTDGSPGAFRILLQQDNNLVMYTKDERAIWSTGTYTNTASTKMRLTLTNEGQLVLDRDGKTIWTILSASKKVVVVSE